MDEQNIQIWLIVLTFILLICLYLSYDQYSKYIKLEAVIENIIGMPI